MTATMVALAEIAAAQGRTVADVREDAERLRIPLVADQHDRAAVTIAQARRISSGTNHDTEVA